MDQQISISQVRANICLNVLHKWNARPCSSVIILHLLKQKHTNKRDLAEEGNNKIHLRIALLLKVPSDQLKTFIIVQLVIYKSPNKFSINHTTCSLSHFGLFSPLPSSCLFILMQQNTKTNLAYSPHTHTHTDIWELLCHNRGPVVKRLTAGFWVLWELCVIFTYWHCFDAVDLCTANRLFLAAAERLYPSHPVRLSVLVGSSTVGFVLFVGFLCSQSDHHNAIATRFCSQGAALRCFVSFFWQRVLTLKVAFSSSVLK